MAAELVGGALYLSRALPVLHGHARFRLAAPLARFDDGAHPDPWWFASGPELHLGEDVLVPHVASWRRRRMSTFPDMPAIELAPDWVCEILSPANCAFAADGKHATYAAHGIGHLWVVDPEARRVEAFALSRGAWTLAGSAQGDDPVSLPPFDATAFPLSALWP
ncbi:MAG: Uma2 family endonuclease [Amaricoccus sp.]